MTEYVYTGRKRSLNGFLIKQIKYSNGKLGGWILGDYCLRGNAYIGPDVIVTGCVCSNAEIYGNSRIDGTVGGHARIYNSQILGTVTGTSMIENSIICREAIVSGDVKVQDGAIIHKSLSGNVRVKGVISLDVELDGDIKIFGNGILNRESMPEEGTKEIKLG